ncbi:hypothetical protein KI811_09070 [Geobacter hydrogenophilus]|uniref:hypothetical protein n=1 Tax=Geobacter hydrogenophilus TaxID=40983 RepID=UPI001BDB0569|nr:hypothetical protein [Geobacter hydrogenophilus]MBT0893960.1 hypothetical protein [Geobacter hydrogenophilus]
MRMPAHRLLFGLFVFAAALLLAGCFTSSFHGSLETSATITNNSPGRETEK